VFEHGLLPGTRRSTSLLTTWRTDIFGGHEGRGEGPGVGRRNRRKSSCGISISMRVDGDAVEPFEHPRQRYEFFWRSIIRGTCRWLEVRFFSSAGAVRLHLEEGSVDAQG
jgi:hypothetical protein